MSLERKIGKNVESNQSLSLIHRLRSRRRSVVCRPGVA